MRLYTASEFAEKYHLHEDTVYRLGREGKLETIRVGRSVRFYDPTEGVTNESTDSLRRVAKSVSSV